MSVRPSVCPSITTSKKSDLTSINAPAQRSRLLAGLSASFPLFSRQQPHKLLPGGWIALALALSLALDHALSLQTLTVFLYFILSLVRQSIVVIFLKLSCVVALLSSCHHEKDYQKLFLKGYLERKISGRMYKNEKRY